MTSLATAPPTAELGVLLIDDHRVFAEALAGAIDAQRDLGCVAVASSAREAMAKAAVGGFDVAIVDLQLPDGDGLQLVAHLRRVQPQARIVVLTGQADSEQASRARSLGADAFLPKGDPLSSVLSAVRGNAVRDDVVRGAAVRGDEAATRPTLTPREREVLIGLAGGVDARRIARELNLSLHTVRDYIKSILAKLGAHSQLDAVMLADRLGLINVAERIR